MNFERAPHVDPHVGEYQKAKTWLLNMFESGDESRINELFSEIRKFAPAVGWDSEEVIQRIRTLYLKKDSEVFVRDSFEAIKELIDRKIEDPKIFEKISREEILRGGGNVKLNQLLYYSADLDRGFVFLHVAPKGEMKLGEIIKSFREGMKKLAEHVQEDERMEKVKAISWIVAAHPGLLEKAGFTVEGSLNEKREADQSLDKTEIVGSAYIEREDLLKRYL